MAKIAILLPRQTILEYARKVLQEKNLTVPILKVVDNASAVAQAKSAMEAGCQIIIARGLQALMIKAQTNVPVVEMTMSTQEVGLMIQKAKKVLKKEHPIIGIIGFTNMFGNMEYLEEIFEFTLKIYLISSLEEVRDTIHRAINEGVEMVIGGLNVTQTAFEMGFPCLFIETREDSIRYALDIAEKMEEVLDAEHHNNSQLETIFDTSFNGIVKINACGEIVAVNKMIENLLEKKAETVVGFPIETIFIGLDIENIKRILDGTDEVYSSSAYIGNKLFMIMGAPIKYDGNYIGAILTFHKIRSSEKLEKEKIHENIRNGYIARHDFNEILRKSEGIRHCIRFVKSYGLSTSPILLEGETGTEKELFAECIHNNSRAKGPFININCSALNEMQQKNMIFGADTRESEILDSLGAFSSGYSGTLFLQEIEALSAECQWRLYKAVHDGMFWKNDALLIQKSHVRLIVSTSKNLWELVKLGSFREDLYYFICGQRICIPPLRDYPDDIETIARQYIRNSEFVYSHFVEVSKKAFQIMKQYEWPGNLIQLEAFCERVVLTSHKKMVDEGIIRNLLQTIYPQQDDTKSTGTRLNPEAEQLMQLLKQHMGNRGMVAKELNVSTTTVWRRMKKYGII